VSSSPNSAASAARRCIASAPPRPDLVYALIERFQIRCEAHRDGLAPGSVFAKIMVEITSRVADLAAQGENVELVDRERMAALRHGFYRGGMLDRRSGTVQPLSYARGLATAAAASGARIFGGVRVSGFEQRGGAMVCGRPGTRHREAGPDRHNGYTGDCTGAQDGDGRRAELPDRDDPLPPHLDRAVLPTRLPVSDLMQLGVYFRRDDDGRFIIGGRGSLTERERLDLFEVAAESAYMLYPALRDVASPCAGAASSP